MDEEILFKECQGKLTEFIIELASKGASPLMIAGILSAASVSIYKYSLNDAEFNELMQNIIDTANNSEDSTHTSYTVH